MTDQFMPKKSLTQENIELVPWHFRRFENRSKADVNHTKSRFNYKLLKIDW